MARVIGLSGAQGGGKTSLLEELERRGYEVDRFRVSRAVQASLRWESLENVMSSPLTMIDFQNEVFAQKLKHDANIRRNDVLPESKIVLTERTFADIVAYTNQWTWRFVDQRRMALEEAMRFLSPFRIECITAQLTCYSGTLLLPYMDPVQWDDTDAQRAKKEDIDSVYSTIVRFFNQPALLSHPTDTIKGRTIQERADEVEAFVKTIGEK